MNLSIDEWNELPWWHQWVYVEGMVQELTGDPVEGEQGPEQGPTRVLDLDEDGFDSLAQFGMQMQAV